MQFTVTKVDAAERQLRQAILLFFGEGDEISTHTLTCAAHDVLRALSVKKGGNSPLHAHTTVYVRPDKVDYVLDLIRAPQNFFKHATRDPDATLAFSPESTMWLIFDACIMHSEVTRYFTPETYTFLIWLYVEHPDLLLDGLLRDFFNSPLAQSCRITDRGAVLDAIAFLRRTRGDRIPSTGPAPGEKA